MRSVQHGAGRRLRPARPHRLRDAGGADRQADARHADQAALVARRGHDQGTYHPITQCKLTGALDKDNNLTGLRMRISGQSILAGIAPDRLVNGRDPAIFQGLNPGGTEGAFGYDIPNLLIDHAMRNPHITPGFWRGVNNNQNAIYLECFIDEVAHAAGQDPLEFRRKMMKKHPQASRRAQRRRREGRTGASRCRRACSAASRSRWATAATSPPWPKSRCRATASSRSTASSAPPTAAMPSTRCRSSGRSPARSCTACRRCSTAAAR